MRCLRAPLVITYSAIALAPACTSGSIAPVDASVEAAASDAGECPALTSSCAVGSADLSCKDLGGYPYSLQCVGGAWCETYLNPPPPHQPGDQCPSAPPVNGAPCSLLGALLMCTYQCGAAQASVVCNQFASAPAVWCGVVAPTCTLIVDAGADAALSDAGSAAD